MTKDEELIERIDKMLLASPVDEYTTMIAVEPDDLREIRNRLEALARPVVGVEIEHAIANIRNLVIDLEAMEPELVEYIRLTPQAKLVREWLAASPSPVVGDREALQEAHDAIDQALDDMGAQGHCVCPEAKDWLGSARTKAANALSTPVVGGEWLPIADALPGEGYMAAFKAPLRKDGRYEIVGPGRVTTEREYRNYLGPWQGIELVYKLPDPHTTDRAGMAQEVE